MSPKVLSEVEDDEQWYWSSVPPPDGMFDENGRLTEAGAAYMNEHAVPLRCEVNTDGTVE